MTRSERPCIQVIERDDRRGGRYTLDKRIMLGGC